MGMKVEHTCPLGSECEKAENNVIKRCAWYTKLAGTDPNTGKELEDWGCAMAWLPTLLIENASQSRSTSIAVESFRNEMVASNDLSRELLISTDKKLVGN
tara:strand:+ start:1842 stop:2141 length:300 start_codon:yes stop_codon:yes gene_type:complete